MLTCAFFIPNVFFFSCFRSAELGSVAQLKKIKKKTCSLKNARRYLVRNLRGSFDKVGVPWYGVTAVEAKHAQR